MTKIVVYFETPNNSYAEVVAHFADDDLYNACLPILEAQAQPQGYIVTESVREDEEVTNAEDD
jgi:urate oxidase